MKGREKDKTLKVRKKLLCLPPNFRATISFVLSFPGQEIRRHPPDLVLHLHDLCVPVRAQRLRGVQPAGVRQQLLKSTIRF